MGANFAELGAVLINDTPQSKLQSSDFRSAYRSGRNISHLKNKTIENSSNLGLREQTRRYSMVRSSPKTGAHPLRGSRTNLINPGGLNHFSFI